MGCHTWLCRRQLLLRVEELTRSFVHEEAIVLLTHSRSAVATTNVFSAITQVQDLILVVSEVRTDVDRPVFVQLLCVSQGQFDTLITQCTDVVLVCAECKLSRSRHVHDNSCGLAVVVVQRTGQSTEESKVHSDTPKWLTFPKRSSRDDSYLGSNLV